MRVALLVEGSDEHGERQAAAWLERTWKECLGPSVGGPALVLVEPISKADVVAMNTAVRPVGAEAVDLKLKRLGAGTAFDAAIVAWDLHPKWDDEPKLCRWRETLRLYEGLSASSVLPYAWQQHAAQRLTELRSRPQASARSGPAQIEPNATLALCMEPEFESLLVSDERALKRALGVIGSVEGWPRRWRGKVNRHPGHDLVGPAIRAARSSGARHPVRRGWEDAKNEWGFYLLSALLSDAASRKKVIAHPIPTRVAEMVP